MSTTVSNQFSPDFAVAPGETLSELLDDNGMSQAELARRTGLSAKHINQIVSGDASITAETAIRLERVTKVPSRFWLNLEAQYQDLVTRQREALILQADVPWLKELPVRELLKRGYLKRSDVTVDPLRQVLAFFGVVNRGAWGTIWQVPTAYRTSRVLDVNGPALATWLRIGELKAIGVEAKPFSKKALQAIIPELRSLTVTSSEIWEPKLKSLCASVGVVVIFEPEIPGSRISGAVRWVESDRALVQMSLRHRWGDIFWFSFFHEIAHVLLHDRKRLTFVDGPPKDGNGDDLELEADAFASHTLVPKQYDAHLQSLDSPRAVKSFAAQLGIHPGVVVGRLQHDRLLSYSAMNNLRVRYEFAESGS